MSAGRDALEGQCRALVSAKHGSWSPLDCRLHMQQREQKYALYKAAHEKLQAFQQQAGGS